MRALCFIPDQNTPGRVDQSGAFLPEARAFARYHQIDPELVVLRFPAIATMDKRRRAVTLAIQAQIEPLDVLAFFCHGWRTGIQAGFERSQVLLLARLVAQHAALDAHVLLYACDTGRDDDTETADDKLPGPGGDGGFADELRDACEALSRRVTVIGHTTAGHCATNPFARFFAPGCGGHGGQWFVEPESELWQRWVKALRDPRSTLRFRFWAMTPDEIADELRPRVG